MTKNRKKRKLVNETAVAAVVNERNIQKMDALLSVILATLLKKGVVSQAELEAEFLNLTTPQPTKTPEEAPSEQP